MGIKDQLGDQPYELPKPIAVKAFDGKTYNPSLDHARLNGQMARVFALMSDGLWRTLEAIAKQADGTEAAVSARLRDLRKTKYGGHTVERRRVGGGLFEYKLTINRGHNG